MARFQIKPPLLTLKNGDSLARNLVFLVPFDEKGGTKARDLLKRFTPTLSGTYSRVKSGAGIAVSFDGVTGQCQIAADSRLDGISLGAILLVIQTTQSSFGNGAHIHGRINASQSNGGINIMMAAGGVISIQIKTTGGSATAGASGTVVCNDGKPHVILMLFSQANGGSIKVYVDGKLDISTTNSAAWTWNGANVVRWAVPVDGFWSKFNGSVLLTGWWNRNLSPGEIKRVLTNPWCMFNRMSKLSMIVKVPSTNLIKSISAVARASIKSINGIAVASIKSVVGIPN